MKGHAIVSIHDVWPETLEKVLRIVALLEKADVPPATLLVVPGRGWESVSLGVLRDLTNRGHRLAGHGWVHKAPRGRRTLFHRAHALLISRNEAEHLSRSPQELAHLIQKCHDWFSSVDLPVPELYVPPAWALGALRTSELSSLPFRWYEILRGFVEAQTGRIRWLPLAGFEADTTFRKVSLRFWNGLNTFAARSLRGPLRISIHPHDVDLLMSADLARMVRDPWSHLEESEIMGNGTPSKRI